jgi:hypothetical protein
MTLYAKNEDWVFPSFKMRGAIPMCAGIFVTDHLRPAALKPGVHIADGQRFGLHSLRSSLATWVDVQNIRLCRIFCTCGFHAQLNPAYSTSFFMSIMVASLNNGGNPIFHRLQKSSAFQGALIQQLSRGPARSGRDRASDKALKAGNPDGEVAPDEPQPHERQDGQKRKRLADTFANRSQQNYRPEYGHHSCYNDELSTIQGVANFAGGGINRKVARPEPHKNVPVRDQPKYSRRESDAVAYNVNLARVNTAQTTSEMRRQRV